VAEELERIYLSVLHAPPRDAEKGAPHPIPETLSPV
jgi:hypothetical protein